MTIRQTIEIPNATRHLTVDLPQTVPAGTVEVVLFFSTPAKEAGDHRINGDFHQPLPDPRTVEEAQQMGAARAAAERADPSLCAFAGFQGIFKNSPNFQGDSVAVIRAMRDEWD
jgi:hypothetical protein